MGYMAPGDCDLWCLCRSTICSHFLEMGEVVVGGGIDV